MKHLKTYENFKDKIKKLIPESYIIFEYEIYNFETNKKGEYLIIGKNHSAKPYEIDGNYFADLSGIDYITTDKNNKNADYILSEYKDKVTKAFNIDMMKIKFASTSLKTAMKEYKKLKEDFLIRMEAGKYNI